MNNSKFEIFTIAFIHIAINDNAIKINTDEFKEYTKDILEEIFLEEIYAFGETTTLDIKNKLRKRNYYANQSDVSKDIKEIVEDNENIESYSNGSYMVYYLNNELANDTALIDVEYVVSDTTITNTDDTDDVDIDDPRNNIITDNTLSSIREYIRRNGTHMIAYEEIKDVVNNDWECTSNNLPSLYFNSRWTRDQVRAAYASLNKISGNLVRAKRIKN